MAYDPNRYRPPTDAEGEALVAEAYECGLSDADCERDERKWSDEHALIDFLDGGWGGDGLTIDLGSDMESPLIKRLLASYRKGRRDGR